MKSKYGLKQISIFLENRKGRLLEVTERLKEADINIRALSMAESAEFGILRLVVNNPEKAKTVLSKAGFTISEQTVFAAEVDDTPGSFNDVVKILTERDINIDYTYAFVGDSKKAILIFSVKEEAVEEAINALLQNGANLVEPEFFYD